MGITIGIILVLLITNIVKKLISVSIEKGTEQYKEDKVFKFFFGSPEAIGALTVFLVGLLLLGVGVGIGRDFVMGSIFGFAASFFLRLFKQKTFVSSNLIIDKYKAGERDFHNRKLEKIDLSGVDFSGVDLSKANMQGANLNKANLSKANFNESKLMYTNLSGINLSEATLIKANLTYSNLEEANLSKANLNKASLYRANLRGANLFEANLLKADLRWANLFEAQITDDQLKSVKGLKGIIMPDGTQQK